MALKTEPARGSTESYMDSKWIFPHCACWFCMCFEQKQELALTFIDVAENRTLSVARACFDEVSPLISFPPQ